MRIVAAVAFLCIAACASEKLEQSPPPGVDFSGHWKLNEADSDDAQRLIQAPSVAPDPSTGQGGSGRSGGQGGGRGGPGGPGGIGGMAPMGPVMPSMGALGEGLRWPGKQLEIKQVGGVVAFTSNGSTVVCQPMDGEKPPGPSGHGGPPDHDGASNPDRHFRSRDTPPPRCGWREKTLIVRSGEPDEDRPPFEQHFSLSEDGRRLVEVVDFKGRSADFTVSRVWDRTG
jgi:hypothetical protein